MANLNSPSVSVVFTELGITAINRGDKGVVAVILRDTASVDPVALTQASQIPSTLGADNQAYLQRAFLGYVNPPKKVIAYTTDAEDTNLTRALAYMATQDFDYLVGPADCSSSEAAAIATWVDSQRTNNGAKYKAVLPNQASDKYPIINFTASGMTDGTEEYTTAEYCSGSRGCWRGRP